MTKFFLKITSHGEEICNKEISGDNQIEDEVATWVDEVYNGEFTVDEPNGWIPTGCGDFYAEIVDEDQSEGSCWSGMDFYLKHYDEE